MENHTEQTSCPSGKTALQYLTRGGIKILGAPTAPTVVEVDAFLDLLALIVRRLVQEQAAPSFAQVITNERGKAA